MTPLSHSRRFRKCVSILALMAATGCLLFVDSVFGQDQSAKLELGEQLYAKQCASCHGAKGQGSDDYDQTLTGDLSIEELGKYISDTMPEGEPELCVGEDALSVASYIHQAFYSSEAQAKRKEARVRLSRLTVRQYRESIADLVGSFSKPVWHGNKRGITAHYFASRNWTEKRRIAKQVDPSIDFGDGVPNFDPTGEYADIPKPEKKANNMNDGFGVFWNGSIIAPKTGRYKITIESKNGFEFRFNDSTELLIDRWVRSDEELRHSAEIYLLGGRAYPFNLRLFSYPDPPAQIRLCWTPPGGPESVIPSSQFLPHNVPESIAVATSFPADDASTGYERGISVSRQWDESTTRAALEVADWLSDRIWKLAKTKPTDPDRLDRIKDFCHRFVEHAFVSELDADDREFFVGQHFKNELPIKDQLKRVILLSLKSPRFLYPELQRRDKHFSAARRVALVLWDSLPDEHLTKLAANGRLGNREALQSEVARMVEDPRAKSKLHDFFEYWLRLEHVATASKDPTAFPRFDERMMADLERSLLLGLDEVLWNDASDFRELFLADYLYVNKRLADYYRIPVEFGDVDSNSFNKVAVDPQRRAGILTHPYLMAGFAYDKSSSPIHRGVFVARSLLGRTLKQPPENVEPLDEAFDPSMTTRQRVEHQTREKTCMSCHSVINPLGFSLENYDAVGRFRDLEKDKAIDVTSVYRTPHGADIAIEGPRDLAEFLVANSDAQKSFVRKIFQHYVKQPPYAFGPERLDQLHTKFSLAGFQVRQLLVDVAVVAALETDSPQATKPAASKAKTE